jgi:WXG100 family type VII secretion target
MPLQDGIKVHHGTLEQGATDVLQAAKAIEARLDTLENELKPLAGDWTGSARAAYVEAKATWDEAMTSMIVLLQQSSQGVDASNAEYRAADLRGAARF